MAENEDVRWGLARRFEFLEWRAYWVGRVNRIDLEERFGVSTPQASLDLRAYLEAAPGNLQYDATERAYLPTADFKPKYLRLSADRYLLQLDAILNSAVANIDTWFGSVPPATVVQTLTRSVEPPTLRALLTAIQRRLQLTILYQSLTNTRERAIVPHALAFDGHRWHARAWCVEHEDFRDFVLSRMHSVGLGATSDSIPSNDMEWNTLVRMKIIAHPKLDEAQRGAIERDYGMTNGELVLTTRASLSFYLIRRLNLDLSDEHVKPERKQIFLTNLAEIGNIQKAAQEETRVRVAGSRKSPAS